MVCLLLLSSSTEGGEEQLLNYCKRPTPLQSQEITLHPDACGKCHKYQYSDWKGSLHSRAVGPGLLGQLSPDNDPEFAASCYFCHAPMMEQSEVKTGARSKGQGASNYIKNQSFDNRLKLSGVSCSVCHLREGKIYGPPKRVRSRETGVGRKDQDSHGGFIENDFFEDAEFCAACHQLDEGYELNGKLLTNTYREWKESIYGQGNVTCQMCHMPDRRHLFRGIHDPEMVKSGIAIEASRSGNKARLVISNTGVGHFFPTYVTPQVVVRGFVKDAGGKAVRSSVKEAFIGRKVSTDLGEEFFDTRIAPGKRFDFDYSMPVKGGKAVFEVWVYPDEFYNRLYKALLRKNNNRELKKALKTTGESGYLLFRTEL